MEWQEIVYLAMAILGLIFGFAFWRKFEIAIRVLRELGELLTKTGQLSTMAASALKDRKVTKAEAVLLLKAWQDACQEFKDVYDVLMELLPASAIKFLLRR